MKGGEEIERGKEGRRKAEMKGGEEKDGEERSRRR